MIQSSLNSLVDGGYAGHDDSGTFDSDNDLDYGDEDHNMMVPSFFGATDKMCSQRLPGPRKATTLTRVLFLQVVVVSTSKPMVYRCSKLTGWKRQQRKGKIQVPLTGPSRKTITV